MGVKLPNYLLNFELISRETVLSMKHVPLVIILKNVLLNVESRHVVPLTRYMLRQMPEVTCQETLSVLVERIDNFDGIFDMYKLIDNTMHDRVSVLLESRLAKIIDRSICNTSMWIDSDKVISLINEIERTNMHWQVFLSKIMHNVIINMCIYIGKYFEVSNKVSYTNIINIVNHLKKLQMLTSEVIIDALKFDDAKHDETYYGESYYDYHQYYNMSDYINIVKILMSCVGRAGCLTPNIAEHMLCYFKYCDYGDYVYIFGLQDDALAVISKNTNYFTFGEFVSRLYSKSEFGKLEECIAHVAATYKSTPMQYVSMIRSLGMGKYITQKCVETLVRSVYYTKLEFKNLPDFCLIYRMDVYCELLKVLASNDDTSRLCNVHTISVMLKYVYVCVHVSEETQIIHEHDVLVFVLRFVTKALMLAREWFTNECLVAIEDFISRTDCHIIAYIKAIREHKYLTGTVIRGMTRRYREKRIEGKWLLPFLRVLEFDQIYSNMLFKMFSLNDFIETVRKCDRTSAVVNEMGLRSVVNNGPSSIETVMYIKELAARFPKSEQWILDEVNLSSL